MVNQNYMKNAIDLSRFQVLERQRAREELGARSTHEHHMKRKIIHRAEKKLISMKMRFGATPGQEITPGEFDHANIPK